LVKTLYSQNSLIIVSKSDVHLTELKSQYPKIQILKCDLSDIDKVKDLINTCHKSFPQINILFNNAGIELNYDLENNIEVFDKIQQEINVNFTSPMMLMAGLIPLLKEHKESAIINVSSGLIYAHKENAVVYSATKSAMHGASISLREQLKETSIKVFEIVPPLTDTPLTKNNPHKKISTQKLVDEFLKKFKKDELEINIGIIKYLKIIQALFPKLTKKIINKRSLKT
jgi:short-subunit dehydrogenase involved in D-alanine esterification of teichoic acids